VTQPTAGTFKAFSKVCTHQGCTVASVSNGHINCACHGSTFSATDGSVVNGPAKTPLAETKVTLSGDSLVIG
jgi:Rieske Fe-S protein